MSGPRANAPQGRRERLEQLRAQERSKERRRAALIYGIAAVVALAVILGTVFAIRSAQDEQQSVADAAKEDIEGVQEFETPSNEHVEIEVDYPESPPVGGDHNPVWLNCGVYTEPVPEENVVHSLEHGAVWLTYQPDLDEDQVATLEDFAADEDYLVVSPYEGQESPVVATAWGLQLELESTDDPRLAVFVEKYVQGAQTPEPGASCFGGVGN
ncbi:MAG TPA: DUF3105 domain-containing protein [Nocardioidaceae bacterium]|nr:DUF3105 domain-containing protein [Nocardioidaceae bacterium]